MLKTERSVRRRVRKSRQNEAAGAADAGLMQIEWGERGVSKFLGVVRAAAVPGGAAAGTGIDARNEARPGQEKGVGAEQRHTSARCWEARRQCGVWASDFMQRRA